MEAGDKMVGEGKEEEEDLFARQGVQAWEDDGEGAGELAPSFSGEFREQQVLTLIGDS